MVLTLGYIKEKWGHAGFQKYLKSAGWMFFSRIASLAFTFFISAYIVRKLGPINYGELSYAVSFVSIFSLIATFGIDNIIYRELIRFPENRSKYLGTGLVLKFVAGISATTLCLIFAYFSATSYLSLLLISILSFTFIFNSFALVSYEFYARVNNKLPSIISLVVLVILNVLKVFVILSGKGVIYIAFVLLLEPIITSLFLVYIYVKKYGSIFKLSFDKIVARTLLKDSWPLIFPGAFALIYARIDQILIKHMIDTHSVGIYDSAVRISEGWYFIPTIIVSTFFPAIVLSKSISDSEYNKRLGRLAILLLFISIIIALPVTIFAKDIMQFLYGSAFTGGAGVLQIYIWAGVGTSLTALAINYLVNENFRKIIFYSYLTAMLSNVILNIAFIPRYGIIGSAWATFISYSLCPVSLIFFREPRKRLLAIFKIILR